MVPSEQRAGRFSVALCLTILCLSTPALSKSSSNPNLIFLLADDLSYGSAGFGPYGASNSDMSFATPNLNKWAEGGIVLSNYYTQESCTPARAALLTGRFPLTQGMQYGSVESTVSWGVNMTETLFPEVLKSKGSYTNYQLGKWNVGHFSPKLLPTARGFDYYLGYQSGSTEYWSKQSPNTKKDTSATTTKFTDLTYGDGSCYSGYSGSDKHDYSTYFYRDKAVNVIENHDYVKTSLFLYVGFQAVHDPFTDDDKYASGIPKTYVGDSMYHKIKSSVVGRKRRQYAMALYLMDEAVGDIEDAVDAAGQLENTYFIFTSDNGGCRGAGGRNYPLRGNKGTLFEGGTKVDALIYSKLLSSKQQGATYGGLMHVVDWFPTMLDMAGITYKSPSGRALDGASHWSMMSELDKSDAVSTQSPRKTMLYGYYADISGVSIPSTTPVRAVRNAQYKYLESSVDETYMGWDETDEAEDDDSSLNKLGSCEQSNSWKLGTWGAYLFDLVNDPYETTNLVEDEAYADIVTQLKAELEVYYDNRLTDNNVYSTSEACFVAFKDAGDFIVPWNLNDAEGAPAWSKKCPKSLISPKEADDDQWRDTNPTTNPTTKPTHQPTAKPTSK